LPGQDPVGKLWISIRRVFNPKLERSSTQCDEIGELWSLVGDGETQLERELPLSFEVGNK
jgi:hypothetical protein